MQNEAAMPVKSARTPGVSHYSPEDGEHFEGEKLLPDSFCNLKKQETFHDHLACHEFGSLEEERD